MFSMPTPTATMREDFERVERLKEKGATTIYSRANNPDGTGRHHGLLTYMGFYDLLPTVQATDYNTTLSPEAKQKAIERHPDVKPSCTYQLRQMAVDGLLPTPLTRDYKGGTTAIRKDTGKVRTDALDSLVKYMAENGMLPTPVTQDFKKRGPNSQQQGIGDLVYELANGSRDSEEVRKSGAAGKTSRLSPLFTEEMMGFPLMWTALPFLSESGAPKPSKPTATPSSPK